VSRPLDVGEASPAGVDPLDLVDPIRFARNGYPHDAWTRLRAEAPVAYFEPEGFKPFWAITKHHDIQDIAAQPTTFSSAHGLFVMRASESYPGSDNVVSLDPPRHGPMRRVAMPRFTPRAIRKRHEEIDRIAAEILDEAAQSDDSADFDFVERVAAPLPIAVISWMLGVPRSDWQLLFNWTNEIIGKEDAEFRRPGETPTQTMRRARSELHAYLGELVEQRRQLPRDDMISHLLTVDIEGTPLTESQLVHYCELLVEAGNETTRNAISGGLLAFSEHPGEWEKLRADPALLPNAVEEILRWVTPIIHFTRFTSVDCEVRGVPIPAGDYVALIYASGNRDEEVFDAPFEFRVDRHPNPHLAFGFAEHFCMGAHLARVELETVVRHLLGRLEWFDIAGPVDRLSSNVNGGIKHLPITCRLR